MAGTFWGGTCSRQKRTYDVNEGESITLSCTTDISSGTIKWIHGDQTFSKTNKNPNYKVTQSDNEVKLKIECVGSSDQGSYICEVKTFWRVATSQEITLNVWNILEHQRPEQTASVRDVVILPCVITNLNDEMPIDVYWTRNSKEIDMNDDRYKMEPRPSTSLQITNVKPQDAGRYECRVKEANYPAQSRPKNSILLEMDPTIFIHARKYVAKQYTEVTLSCEVFGADDFTWKHNDEDIAFGNNRYKINDDKSLTILSVEESDAGQYVCVVINCAGKSVTSEVIELRTIDSDYSKHFLSEESRKRMWDMKTKEENKIQELKSKISDDKACLWFIGHYGAGKSSALSSFASWHEGRVTTVALSGGADTAYTTKVFSKKLLGGKVTLYDFPGFEDFRQFDSKHHLYKTFEEIISNTSEDDPLKCCVVYVLDCSSVITKEDINRMNQIDEYIKEKDNFQMVALLTKIDLASKSAETVSEMVGSPEVCAAIKTIAKNVQLPVNCIFAMYNYHKQTEQDPEMELFHLSTFLHLLERLLDIYGRL